MYGQPTLFSQHIFDTGYAWPDDLWTRYAAVRIALKRPVSWVEHANSYVTAREDFIMPRKAKESKRGLSDFSFVRCRLSRDEKEAFKKWLAANEIDLKATLDHYLSIGIKVSWSWDETNDTFICSFTQKLETSPNAGRCLTSRGGDPYVAIAVNVFKDQEIYGGEIWEDLEADEDFG